MAGAAPRTDWLEDSVILDKKGFIVTGADLDEYRDLFRWPISRAPMLLETSVPGVFAVGEGSMAVHLVHRFLAETEAQTDSLVATV
jgi:thioredoxin reductase (NADPH)